MNMIPHTFSVSLICKNWNISRLRFDLCQTTWYLSSNISRLRFDLCQTTWYLSSTRGLHISKKVHTPFHNFNKYPWGLLLSLFFFWFSIEVSIFLYYFFLKPVTIYNLNLLNLKIAAYPVWEFKQGKLVSYIPNNVKTYSYGLKISENIEIKHAFQFKSNFSFSNTFHRSCRVSTEEAESLKKSNQEILSENQQLIIVAPPCQHNYHSCISYQAVFWNEPHGLQEGYKITLSIDWISRFCEVDFDMLKSMEFGNLVVLLSSLRQFDRVYQGWFT